MKSVLKPILINLVLPNLIIVNVVFFILEAALRSGALSYHLTASILVGVMTLLAGWFHIKFRVPSVFVGLIIYFSYFLSFESTAVTFPNASDLVFYLTTIYSLVSAVVVTGINVFLISKMNKKLQT